MKLGANVVPLGRNPYVLARQLAQLDRQSDGRLLLSFVPGLDQPGERAALGVATGDRWAAVERQVDLARRWWAGEAVDGEDGDSRFEHVDARDHPDPGPPGGLAGRRRPARARPRRSRRRPVAHRCR